MATVNPIRFGLASLLLAMIFLAYFLALPPMRGLLTIFAVVLALQTLMILVQSPLVWLFARAAASDDTEQHAD